MNRFVIIRKGKKKNFKMGKNIKQGNNFSVRKQLLPDRRKTNRYVCLQIFQQLGEGSYSPILWETFFFLLKWISKTTACCTGFGYHPHKHNFLAIRGISADSHWLKTTTTPVGDNCCAMAAIKRVTAFILQEHFNFNTHLQLRSIKQIWMTVREKWME